MFNRVRNGGMFSEKEYVGKTVDEATTYAQEGGFVVRIIETDGQSIMVDMLDINASRLNFRVRDGFVIGVNAG
jgi:hypothetical protein